MSTVAHGDERFRLPASFDRHNRFRHFTTDRLIDERQVYQWNLVEILDDFERDKRSGDYLKESIDYVVTAIEDIDFVLHRRRSLRNRPGAPLWSRGSRRRQEELKAEAESLRSLWPLDCFCIEVLRMSLDSQGQELVGRCPFPEHEDKTPSFSVRADGLVWYCRGCHRGGDLFSLIGQLLGLEGFGEQVHFLKQRTGRMGGTK